MYRLILFLTPILIGLNYYIYRHVDDRWRKPFLIWLLLINSPMLFIFGVYLTGSTINQVPLGLLKWVVYPFEAWVATLLAILMVGGPISLIGVILRGVVRIVNRIRGAKQADKPNLSRRGFIATTATVAPPLLFGVSLRGIYGPHDLDIAPLREIRIPGLAAEFDGVTITQVSDLHTGAYIRGNELDRVVEAVNGLRGDLIAVTGDFMDNSTQLLSVAHQSLSRLKAPLGVFGILGNHDYYADRATPTYQGCMAIMAAMRSAGIHMLRDSHAVIRAGSSGVLILGGVDWTGQRTGNPNSYDSPMTRRALEHTFAGTELGIARILMAHHPHVFIDSPDFGVAFTMAGHTHGGGQIVVAEENGRPIALGTPFYRYMSGLYTERGSSLYVNRGIGYVGLPIRLNCPPEVSRFKLVRG